MSQFPHLPLFVDAYFSDTKHLTCEEHGAYLQLMMFAWTSPGCRIRDDDPIIARKLSLPLKRWLKMKPTIMAFWEFEDGFWSQKRLTKEHAWVAERTEKRRAAGKQGGRPKSLKDNDEGKANGLQDESKPEAPKPTPTPTEEEDTAAGGAPAADKAVGIVKGWVEQDRTADFQFARDHGFSDAEIEIMAVESVEHWREARTTHARKTPAGWSASWRRRVMDLALRRPSRNNVVPLNTEARHGNARPSNTIGAEALEHHRTLLQERDDRQREERDAARAAERLRLGFGGAG